MSAPQPSRTRSRGFRIRAVVAAAAAVLGGGAIAAPATLPAAAAPAHASAAKTSKNVLANLFEWNWPSVAKECTTQLGPAGYAGVQVSAPQDSLKRTSAGNGSSIVHPWYEIYQPVDYGLTSRMGNEAQFKAMVKTCRAAGVKVYVDAVINHMTSQQAASYGGRTYSKYSYPGIYSPGDFHSYPGDCSVPPTAGSGDREGTIRDFNDSAQVTQCELLALSDLDTSSPKVRRTIAGYLNKLIGYGVSGFRVDAAKHVGQTDLRAIQALLHRTADGAKPYFALEVSLGSPGVSSPAAFTKVGNVLGFDYTLAILNAFRSYDDKGTPRNDGNIAGLKVFGQESGLLPSRDQLVFVENHDTERSNDAQSLSYKDPENTIANEFMLAYPYGTPQVYAGFSFGSDTSQSPPADADGLVTDTDCGSSAWVCVDRYPGVKGMVRFHNLVGNAPVRNWTDDGENLIAFSRGTAGFFSTNNETAAKSIAVRTGLPAGRYCDVVHGVKHGRTCSGPTVTVRSGGRATVTVRGHDSVAFTRADRL